MILCKHMIQGHYRQVDIFQFAHAVWTYQIIQVKTSLAYINYHQLTTQRSGVVKHYFLLAEIKILKIFPFILTVMISTSSQQKRRFIKCDRVSHQFEDHFSYTQHKNNFTAAASHISQQENVLKKKTQTELLVLYSFQNSCKIIPISLSFHQLHL